MPVRKAKQTLYMNADRTKLVKEGDPDAAFLFVRKGSAINEAEATRYGFDVSGADVPEYDAVADHAEKHEGESERDAARNRANMFDGEDDPDGPAAPGERGNLEEAAKDPLLDGPPQGDVKATDAPQNTKAVTKAPSNKGA